ncbi:fructosamine kinase family protein [Rhodohalobacter sp. 8-1]|uniref:fructosamine kinase family protein n=1 Tax=Rhodohalobacter sp. 8-1 TaxID=3131972 RepID=UPI0030EBE511
MPLPDNLKEHLEKSYNIDVQSESSVSGGSINSAYCISTSLGDLFLKYNSNVPQNFFERESDGLKMLRSANTNLRIPEVIAADGPDNNRPGFLVMEYIESGRSGDSEQFGAELAKLHQTEESEFGLEDDNYIGSLPQSNRKHSAWESFFSEERIKPQLKMAIDSCKMDHSAQKAWGRLSSKLDRLLPKVEPSLIHGDLWSGNYLFDTNGRAVLIDPAVYYGHPEMDLAFSKMFGGFSSEFYRGYESVSSLENGFEERVPIYNLYPLLVHVNLFGGHYVSQAKRVLDRFS